MRIPLLQGTIRRRLLINYRADPGVTQRLLPARFRPKLHGGQAMVGICLIRLEYLRPAGFPGLLGLSSENAAHRIAVEWTDAAGGVCEGVYIPRRDTDSLLSVGAGGRIFPGDYHLARFRVADKAGRIDLAMEARDGSVAVEVVAEDTDDLPDGSCFKSMEEASRFFEGGSLGYSATRDPQRLDGIRLRVQTWKVRTLAVRELRSTFFDDEQRFPKGTLEFDHGLVMRDMPHEWRQAEALWSVAEETATAG